MNDFGNKPIDVLREAYVGATVTGFDYMHEDDSRKEKIPAEVTGVRMGTDEDFDPALYLILDGGIGRGGDEVMVYDNEGIDLEFNGDENV